MAEADHGYFLSGQFNDISENLLDPLRKSFCDCIENLNNQKVDVQYHQESTQFKGKRGSDVCLNLQTGFVVQTTVSEKELLINICYNDYIPSPRQNFAEEYEKQREWSLSYFLSQLKDGRDEFRESYICDILFHPAVSELNHIHQCNIAFKCLENHYKIYVDSTSIKYLDLDYVGNLEKTLLNDYIQGCVYSRGNSEKIYYLNERLLMINETPCQQDKSCSKHQYRLSMQELHKKNDNNSVYSFMTLRLPLLQCISMDITEKTIQLLSQIPFDCNLNISLPYALKESCSIDAINSKHLVISLLLNIHTFNDIMTSVVITHEDSGVDSDIGSPEHKYNQNNMRDSRNNIIEPMKKFFDSNTTYLFPSFNISTSDNVIMFALNIKNIEEDSLTYICVKNYLSIKCSGIDCSRYAFIMKVDFEISDIQTEIWDNTVTIQFKVNDAMESKDSLMCPVVPISNIDCGNTSPNSPNYQNSITSKNLKNLNLTKSKCRPRNITPNKVRSISESSEDTALLMKRNVTIKGILKCSSMSRSVSESSVDDHFGFSMSLDHDFNSSFEFTSTSLDPCKEQGSSTEVINKKTVRFKDVVAKQIFRYAYLFLIALI